MNDLEKCVYAVYVSGCDTHLAEEARVESGQFGGHVLLVHVVELMKRSSGREATLHQVQH